MAKQFFDDVFGNVGVEILLSVPDDFLKIKETLTRIGVASEQNHALYQSCHILHKRDPNGTSRYAIVHFKEMFKLDGKPSSLDMKDIARRNSIVGLLVEWGLLEVLNPQYALGTEDLAKEIMPSIKVLKYSEKPNWELVPKYKIGRK